MSIFSEAIGNFLSPIGDLLDDETITEIMINGSKEIFVEQKGLVHKVPNQFPTDNDLMSAMRAIAQSVGKVLDQDNPRLDARLPDGSRIHVVLPPMSRAGVTVAIRKFSKDEVTFQDLIDFNSVSLTGARFLDICVYLGKNIVVSGGTGSGKTTMLNVLGGRVPKTQRLLIIEDNTELQIKAEHVLCYETRKEDLEKGIEEVSIRDLVISAMRLRPDRVIVGEVRGEEALDLLQVMNTGHDGSMGTVHANNPVEACTRLETLCLMGGSSIPPDAIRKMVASAMGIIVQCSRYRDGGRRTSHISEILGLDQYGNFVSRDIFRWVQKDKDPDTGEILGEMVPCNYIPSFFDEIVVNQLPFPKTSFITPEWARKFLSKKAA